MGRDAKPRTAVANRHGRAMDRTTGRGGLRAAKTSTQKGGDKPADILFLPVKTVFAILRHH